MRRSVASLEALFISSMLASMLLLGTLRAADHVNEAGESADPPTRESAPETDGASGTAADETVLTGGPDGSTDESNYESDGEIELSQEVRPLRRPQPVQPIAPAPAATAELAASLFGPGAPAPLSPDRRDLARRPGTSVVPGSESTVRTSSDVGSLLGKSQASPGIGIQRRTPIVTDTRPRGGHSGQQAAAGSNWVPARLDLDTLLSKIDSGIISDVIAIKGPYTARYGPTFSVLDFELRESPRYADGPEWHGQTSLNYQTNGAQWNGRQTLFGGSTDWGMRVGYGHRTGSDYEAGDGTELPSSYKSRDLDVAIGMDLSPDSHLEFSFLRLDQTDVEFPGQIFDINFLVTDAYELKYVLENQCSFDRLVLETWYNRTKFEGDAQRAGKRRQIPFLDPVGFIGFTDADVMSTGFSAAATWGQDGCPQLTLGADLRYVKQELHEFDAFNISIPPDLFVFEFGKLIAPSHASDPGLFVEHVLPVNDRLTIKTGARVDFVDTTIEGNPTDRLFFAVNGSPIIDETFHVRDRIDLRDGRDDRDFDLWSAYITAEYELCQHVTALGGFGYAQRPPTLTELYADNGPFVALLQQGGNFLVGNGRLDPERLWQLDVGLKSNCGSFRGGISGFYAWVHDSITPEFLVGDPIIEIRLLQFENTDLATLAGGELYAEYDWNCWLTPFATMSYVEGRDHSRDNRPAGLRDPVLAPAPDEEPLPGIPPLESRVGFRFHEPCTNPRWGVEFSARIVDNQDRPASSLLERETPGFTTYDLRSYWQATHCLLLVAGVENFTDKHYREHLDVRTGLGVFQPGVNFYCGFQLNY